MSTPVLTPEQAQHVEAVITRIGRAFRHARIARRRSTGYVGFSQHHVANALGSSPTDTSRLECGRTNASLAKITKFLDHVGLTLIVVPKADGAAFDRQLDANEPEIEQYIGGCDIGGVRAPEHPSRRAQRRRRAM